MKISYFCRKRLIMSLQEVENAISAMTKNGNISAFNSQT